MSIPAQRGRHHVNESMGRKKDLKQLDRVAREEGLPSESRRDFGEYLHRCKKSGAGGSGPRGDFTESELREMVAEFKEGKSKGPNIQ
jgi:hypothetical protein